MWIVANVLNLTIFIFRFLSIVNVKTIIVLTVTLHLTFAGLTKRGGTWCSLLGIKALVSTGNNFFLLFKELFCKLPTSPRLSNFII